MPLGQELWDRLTGGGAPDDPYRAKTTEEAIQRFLKLAGGDLDKAQAMAMRYRTGRWEHHAPFRDAQHYFLTQQALRDHPALAYSGLLGIPAYSAAKGVAQALPSGLGRSLDAALRTLGIEPLADASPPSTREVRWGMQPLFDALGVRNPLSLGASPTFHPTPEEG